MANDIQYMEFIHKLALSGDNRIFLNTDEDHALNVLVEIFQISQKIVRIFAGNLCQHVGNKEEYVNAISDFIERGGEVKVLLNNYNENTAKESDLFKRLAYFVNQNKPIVVKRTKAKPYRANDPKKSEVHFTVGDDKAYRMEYDIEKRAAECSFNNPVVASSLAEFFDEQFDKRAETINITELFV
ncbi:MAG: hypothetical protein MJ001_02040 [Paludibacteraceae bacterium]|nr:hypothetical protein [Paludibacteraceae bacterium]